MSKFKSQLILVLLFLSLPFCSREPESRVSEKKPRHHASTQEPQKVRPPALAGSWYPADKDSLRQEVDNYLATAARKSYPQKRLVSMVSPHAGYAYSGLAAAYGYNRTKRQEIERVIILAPSHYHPYQGVSIPDATHYETPLGKVPVDRATVTELLKHPLFSNVPEAHTGEHSLEIQLPMLQRTLKDFSLVPLVLGQVGKDRYPEIADAIRPYINEKTLVIASSDFTHFGARFNYIPFDRSVKAELRRLDRGAVDFIMAKDFDGFLKYKEDTGITICGFVPVALLLKLLPGNVHPELLHYYTSGDLTGDFTSSVSYVSLAFYENEAGTSPKTTGAADLVDSGFLDEREQETLLKLSRETLNTYIRTGQPPLISPQNHDFSPRLISGRGVFVTLNKDGQLRGCIGNIIGHDPLFLSTVKSTINSGVNDKRFNPVTAEELDDIEIEISVLTPPVAIPGPDDFIVGKHGIILQKKGRSAVYLPQVAQEQGWNREETLTRLSEKAGLLPDAWKEGSEFFVFEAQVFEEKT